MPQLFFVRMNDVLFVVSVIFENHWDNLMDIYEHCEQIILQQEIFLDIFAWKFYYQIPFENYKASTMLLICAKRLDPTGVKVFEQLN